MVRKPSLLEVYPDLLDGGQDPALTRLVEVLDKAYAGGESPTHARASTAQALNRRAIELRQVTPCRFGPVLWPPFPNRRLGTIVAALLLVFALAGAAAPFAVPILERAFNADPSTQRILGQGRGKDIGQAATASGFTLTIGRAYADANRIVIGYTISGPPGRTFNNFHLRAGRAEPTLLDAQGREIQNAPRSWGAGVEGDMGGYVLIYEGAEGMGPGDLALRLVVPGIEAYEQVGAAVATVAVVGPFTFDFTVPFEPGRVVEPRQLIEVGGAVVMLERVVVTPTGTRVFLRGAGPGAVVELTIGDSRYTLQPWGATPSRWERQSVWSYVSDAALMDKYGEWTLVVRPGQQSAPLAPGVEGGVWTFRFAVP